MSAPEKDGPISREAGASRRGAVFVTTHWSVVLSAQDPDSPRAFEALEALCQAYWYPLYAFIRGQGRSPHDAQDLTQAFFAKVLEKNYLRAAAREKGRFRTFLLTAFKHFLADDWDRRHAQKRGGFATVLSIDQEQAESRFAAEPAHGLQPDILFDRQWATILLERVTARLENEYKTSGREALFNALRACLVKDEEAASYARIASRLDLTEAAVKMAVHRLRGRYREILRAEIAETVSSPEEVKAEIRHLFSTFGS